MLTLADVLQMPAVRTADPQVVAGGGHLDREVRWVHTTELADIGPLLRGGDLVLTTGIALPDHDQGLTRFALSLADSGAAGLFVELGRRWSELPAALVGQCEARGLPLVALRREVRFAAVAQAVGERLVDAQLAELRAAERVHETFTELSINEAGPADILAAAQRLSGATVVLETEQHRIVDYLLGPAGQAASSGGGSFLDDWERRSRSVRTSGRTEWDASNGWLVTRVGRPERGWGRLVIGAPQSPSPGLIAVAERAAAALAMHRLHDRSRDGHIRRVHHELLIGLLSDPGNADTHRRAHIAGLPPGRLYVGLALRPQRAAALDDLVAACLRAGEVTRTPTLASVFESEVRAIVAPANRGDADKQVDRWADEVILRVRAVVTAGTPVDLLGQADRTLLEATQVLAALPVDGPGTDVTGVRRLDDVHLRGLLTLLADDPRVSTFADRELARLRGEPELTRTLRALVEHPESKSAAATALNVSRPVLYDRIARLERVLGLSLTDAEVRTSLHVALLAADLRRP
jgi:purine catabolism regulator